MAESLKNTYDVVIIGAGLSGLVCGCYLAKAGMKVLIAEQHYKPGGYCTSFKRQGFTFSAAAHFLGGIRYGNLKKIFDDHDLEKIVKIKKYNPSNIIMTPGHKVSFGDDLEETIKGFQDRFPGESQNVRAFFSYLMGSDPGSTIVRRKWTFKDLLDEYFEDDDLKSILGFPLLGNAALPPSMTSAFIGTKIFKEFVLDGGYYPEGGIQKIPEAFAQRFQEYGGELRLSCPVRKIRVRNGAVNGIYLSDRSYISARYVVSNCDARQTFLRLLGKSVIGGDFCERLGGMIPSLSGFILYMGTDGLMDKLPEVGTNIWVVSKDGLDLDAAFLSIKKGDYRHIDGYLLYVSPDKKVILAFLPAPFKDKKFWIRNKPKLAENLMGHVEKDVIPDLKNHIKFMDAATPQTLFRYTGNYKGAAFGWACLPSQLAITDFRKPSFIKGLYMTGHWTTKGFGIPGVIYVGEDTARMILRKAKA